MARMTSRVSVYWMPCTWRLTKLSKRRGQAMSSAMPPKWASIWSARMIEIAIVISAWRRSWPWFQRRKTCCMHEPHRGDDHGPTTAGKIQCVRLIWLLASPNEPPSPTKSRWSLSAM